MKVYVRLEVFESERAWVHLLKLLDLFLDGRHVWDLSELEAIEQSRWLQHDPNSPYTQHSMYVMKLAIDSVYRSADDISSTINVGLIGDHNTIVVNDAYRVLSLPACVIVENAESDGAFLSAVSAAYKRTNIVTAMERRWLRFVHAGGGGEIPKRIHELLYEKYQSNRILVLVDSDRKAPRHGEGRTLEKIRRECSEHNIQLCVLRKREIENYIPINALAERVRSSRRYKDIYQAFLHLNQEQRDFFDMKFGFSRNKTTGKAILDEDEKALYPRDKLPRNVIDDLCGGFGEDVWRCFLVGKVENKEITQQDFESLYFDQPSQMEEIDDLLKRIERML